MLQPIYGLKPDKVDVEYGSHWAASATEEYLENYTARGMDVYDDAIRAWAEVMYSAALKHRQETIFLDKTPRYFFIIPELYRLFPKAKFIFLLRNPLAVLSSELNTYVKDDWTVLGLFKPDLVDAPQLILDGIKLVGDNAIVVNYENFVSNPEQQLLSLCSKLGIEYHQSMLFYENTPQPIGKMNDPIGIHQHSKPSVASLEKWHSLTKNPQHLYFAKAYLKQLGSTVITAMGYNYDELCSKLNETKLDERNLFPWNLAIKSKNQVKFKERLYMQHYFLKAKHGKLKGTYTFLSQIISTFWQKLLNNVAK